jgi:hypothetical protein
MWLVILLPLQVRLEGLPPEEPGLRRTFLKWSIIGWADAALLFYGLWPW